MGGTLEKYDWYSENTFHHRDFSNLGRLLELKQSLGRTISVCLPSMNEGSTVGKIVETIRRDLMEKVHLVDQLCVVDGGSEDETRETAEAMGAEVYLQKDILPDLFEPMGKGDALWRSLYVLKGDIVVWIDSDIRNFKPRFINALVGPILENEEIKFVKAFYQRPLRKGSRLMTTGGGRVTELVARPLLSLFYPELTALIQPLSGEYAGERELLEKIPFFSGYGVEIVMLIDIYKRFGMQTIGQVDLVQRIHRNQPIPALGRMSFQIMQAVLSRLSEAHRIELVDGYNIEMTQVDFHDGEYLLERKPLQVEERPPMILEPRYMQRLEAEA
jgi:glycosyltransferase involved in cell wall biosynthesis